MNKLYSEIYVDELYKEIKELKAEINQLRNKNAELETTIDLMENDRIV